MTAPRAVVREVDGQLVLDDPDALAVARAVAKHHCKATLGSNRERVEHFKRRIGELGESSSSVVIVLVNVDDKNGSALAEALMPGYDWSHIRAQGQVPYARGLASRLGITGFLDLFDAEAADKLRWTRPSDPPTAVVVVDHGVAEVFFT